MLQEAVDEYMNTLLNKALEHKREKQNTILAYRNDLGQLCKYLEAQHVQEWSLVTHEQMVCYLLEMRDGLEYRPTTIARKLAALKSFFRFIRANCLILSDPAEKLEPPHVAKDFSPVLDVEQIRSLFAHIEEGTPSGSRDLAMLYVLYTTGMRSSELVSLQVDDFDGQHGTIKCLATGRQTKHDRVLPLSNAASTAIQCYLDQGRPRLARYSSTTTLFLNHHGEHLTRQGFWLIIKGHARVAGITDLTPHMLRHSFAVLKLKEGVELRSVQSLLGHAHSSTTQMYNKPSLNL